MGCGDLFSLRLLYCLGAAVGISALTGPLMPVFITPAPAASLPLSVLMGIQV